MMRFSALLSVLSVLVALVDSPSHAASFDEGPAYGPQLEGFDYPWAVQHFRFTSQGESLDMAYMDVKPAKPNQRVVVVGPENSCGAPKVVMMQSMGRWELDYLALFGWMDRSAVG